MDLNTQMANYHETARGRADKSRAAAAEARARPKSGWDEFDEATEREAKGHDAEARKWDARAAAARDGKMLVHDDDLVHQHEYGGLIAEADASHRSIHLPDAKGGVYGPGTPGNPNG